MNKKLIIGLLVVTGLVVGYYYFSKKPSVAKKDYTNKSSATQKDGLDFYTKLSTEGNWAYSDEGIGRFIILYSENVTKGKHNQMMDILNSSKVNRSADQTKIIDDTFDSVVEKIKNKN
jgi:hypothetical protein